MSIIKKKKVKKQIWFQINYTVTNQYGIYANSREEAIKQVKAMVPSADKVY